MYPMYESLMPATLNEALDMLAGREDVLPIAGGTNVVVAMREGWYQGQTLMDVTRLGELRGIRLEGGYVVIGGGTTVAELLDSALIADHARPLYQAAQTFANPLVRKRATVAGNIVDASPAADAALPLLVLHAEVVLASAIRTRRLPLDQFIVGVNRTVRRLDELVVAIRWPIPPAHSAAAFHKLALRKGTACSVLSAAVMVEGNGQGLVSQARIALGAVAAKPIRAYAAEKALAGQVLTETIVEETARLAAGAAQPIDDVRSTATYRKRMVGVLTRRLLVEVAAELGWE
ncbi:FAD binding domain-containing protein [Chloroflexota bacterium]